MSEGRVSFCQHQLDDFAKATSEFTDSSVTVSYLEIYNEESWRNVERLFFGGSFVATKIRWKLEIAPFCLFVCLFVCLCVFLIEKKTERAHFWMRYISSTFDSEEFVFFFYLIFFFFYLVTILPWKFELSKTLSWKKSPLKSPYSTSPFEKSHWALDFLQNINQVIQFVTILFPSCRSRLQPLSSGHVNSPSQTGHKLAESPGFVRYFCVLACCWINDLIESLAGFF